MIGGSLDKPRTRALSPHCHTGINATAALFHSKHTSAHSSLADSRKKLRAKQPQQLHWLTAACFSACAKLQPAAVDCRSRLQACPARTEPRLRFAGCPCAIISQDVVDSSVGHIEGIPSCCRMHLMWVSSQLKQQPHNRCLVAACSSQQGGCSTHVPGCEVCHHLPDEVAPQSRISSTM